MTTKSSGSNEGTGRAALLDAMVARSSRTTKRAKVQIQRTARGAGRASPPRAQQGEKYLADQPFSYETRGLDHPEVVSGAKSPDNMLVARLKELLNESGLCRRDLYDFIGEDASSLFANRNQVYNLEYGLRDRPTITDECAQRWLKILGRGEDYPLSIRMLGTGALVDLLALRAAVLAGEGPEELRARASAIGVSEED